MPPSTCKPENAFVGMVIVQPPAQYINDLMFPKTSSNPDGGIPLSSGYCPGQGAPGNGILGTLFTKAANDVETYIRHADPTISDYWGTGYYVAQQSLDFGGDIFPTSYSGQGINQAGQLTSLDVLSRNPDVNTPIEKTPLRNYFAISYQGLFQLTANDHPGLYQFAIVSDDGAMLAVYDKNNSSWTTLINNMYFGIPTAIPHVETLGCPIGSQWSLLGCSSSLNDQSQVQTVNVTKDQPALLRIDWYNYWSGMDLHVYYRYVSAGSAFHDPLCGSSRDSGPDGGPGGFGGSYDLAGHLSGNGWKIIDRNHLGTLTDFKPISPLPYN